MNLIGQRYGRLIVRARIEGGPYLFCECDCGKTTNVKIGDLRFGKTQSCGCYKESRKSKARRTHGGNKTRLYRIWCGMKNRCYNPSTEDYQYWGNRGIKICDEWLNDFAAFRKWALSNGYQDNLTIERKDVNKGYFPENCIWIPNAQQSLNTRQIVPLTFKGKTQTASEWAREVNIHLTTLLYRIRHGWSIESALSTRPDFGNSKGGL